MFAFPHGLWMFNWSPADQIRKSDEYIYIYMNCRPGKRVGSGQVVSWVKTGSGQNGSITKGGCFGSGQNGLGLKWVRVETGPGQNGFRVGSGQFG
ncbi:hypothetical protein Hanom_Chr04g00330611 [Helianthus anomalus]